MYYMCQMLLISSRVLKNFTVVSCPPFCVHVLRGSAVDFSFFFLVQILELLLTGFEMSPAKVSFNRITQGVYG